MAEVGITYSTGVPTTVGVLSLDVLLTETTSLTAQATKYAVEKGAPISDHITIENERLSITGWITSSDVYQMTADGQTKLLDAKETLRKMMTDRQLITITTGLDTYSDMVIESCEIARSSEGDQLSVSMGLSKIRKVELRRADIPPDLVKSSAKGKAGSTKTKAGKNSSTTSAPSEPAKSKLADAFDKVFK